MSDLDFENVVAVAAPSAAIQINWIDNKGTFCGVLSKYKVPLKSEIIMLTQWNMWKL